MIKLASWNVNSLKIRLDQVLSWFEQNQIDILALQETKLLDENFPKSIFEDLQYHVVYSGQKTYNGVAVISRFPLEDVVTDLPTLMDPQRRILAVTCAGIRVINLYVPNGAAVGTDKYAYKLDWLDKVRAFVAAELQAFPQLAVLGDFNIAPEDRDVHDPKAWEGSVLCSLPEREAFQNFLALSLKDSFRLFSQEVKLFTWWDYRAACFRRNRGLRIDHILLSPGLSQFCTHSVIDPIPRKSERPSDHAPVWVGLDIV